MDEQTPPTEPQSPPPDDPQPGPQPRRLERSKTDRMLTGVCGGIAKYFGVDATVVRIVAVGLTFLGGAGALLYLAALLLMPEEGQPGPARLTNLQGGRGQALTVLALVIAAGVGVALVGAFVGWILFPIAFLVIAGLFAWWIASGERPEGTPGDILKRAGLGVLLLIVCLLLAVAGGWAAAAGSGAVGASLVIGSGVVLVAAAFARPARWLIMPALSLALAAAFVMATGITLDGGVGERQYHPTSPGDVRAKYELGIGDMLIDLRNADLPPGDHHIKVDMGVGHAVVLVPENVCVSTHAKIGVGDVNAFDSDNGGIDVDHTDARTAPSGTPRLIVEGDLGVGMLDVHHNQIDGRDWGRGDWNDFESGGNKACVGGGTNG
jgi:phage shock protein PspC (stress-responsive transcriptional regulator)